MDEAWRLTAKADALKLRAAMLLSIRGFFQAADFLEIETPYRIPSPAPESHIDAVISGEWFLHTSPELCMKRLLAAGYPRIFQICRCFRAGERGTRHLPEFTLLEWYRSGADYRDLMVDCEALIGRVAADLGLPGSCSWQGNRIDLDPPWERISVREAFARHASMTPEEALSRDCFDEVMADIEPRLGLEKPVFLYDYPAPLGALARLKAGEPDLAERFELYMAGLEMANAFSELTDAGEQRRRFEAANLQRRLGGCPVYPMPEAFLDALPRMPASAAGIALGVDRLAMILADRARIDDVVAFTPETL
ncbi:MAG: EF-P lysine aminoacylase GenX [Deltaproteobacteria bacterium]|nr:EF-P lysine aminoacylase GenX [Deltaproteobacteria bacterium]